MSYTAPSHRAVNELITDTIYNGEIIDNIKYLHGDDGLVDLVGTLRFGNGSTMRGHRHQY